MECSERTLDRLRFARDAVACTLHNNDHDAGISLPSLARVLDRLDD